MVANLTMRVIFTNKSSKLHLSRLFTRSYSGLFKVDYPEKNYLISTVNPTYSLHLGHYFGWIRKHVEIQNNGHDTFVCIDDVKTLSKSLNSSNTRKELIRTMAVLIASGIDPNKTLFFQRSKIKTLSNIDWYLSCSIKRDRLEKYDKAETVAQYFEPFLKSSSSLLTSSMKVPSIIADDKSFDRVLSDIQKLNEYFGLNLHKPLHIPVDINLKNLRQPSSRMASNLMNRGELDKKGCIDLIEPSSEVTEKCKKALSDFDSRVYYDSDKRPGISNLMTIHSLICNKSISDIEAQGVGMETSRYKLLVAEELNRFIEPIRQSYAELLKDEPVLLNHLYHGSEKVDARSESTIQDIHSCIGLHSSPIRNKIVISSDQESSNVTGKKRIFSGIQPTGVLHLGNYFGAVKNWVDFQKNGDTVRICVVDQHALTVNPPDKTFRENILLMAASLIACGIDPEKTTLFQQSYVLQHNQLNTILRYVTLMSMMAGQAHFKDKAYNMKDTPSFGLFTYPVLQAADILLYDSTHVPVGEDQKEHMEVARNIAKKFNKKYGNVFYIPKGIIADNSQARIKSLISPSKKMSKSETNRDSRIEITDTSDEIAQKFSRASVLHSESKLLSDIFHDKDVYDTDSGIDSWLSMHSAITGVDASSILAEYSSMSVSDYRKVISDVVITHVAPISSTVRELIQDKAHIENVLRKGGEKAESCAASVLEKVHRSIGFS